MNILGLVVGILISLGSIICYIPQFYNIIHYKSINGISELTLLLMNIGLMCLTMNSIVYSWSYFFCRNYECAINLLPFIQISISWIMVLIYYIIFIIFKFKKYEKRIFYGIHYMLTYLIFTVFVISLAFSEKVKGNLHFLILFADVLGYTSAIISCLVYLPQIFYILKIKSRGNLSIITYALQTPGNIVIILFQAILFRAPLSTWITYVIVAIEQTIILFLMLYYRHQNNSLLVEND